MPSALRLGKSGRNPTPEPWPPRPTTPVPQRVLSDRSLQDVILNDYINGSTPPFELAQKHGLTVDELIALVRSDAVYARLKALEAFAIERAHTIAILHLPAAMQRLVETAASYSANPGESRRAAAAIVREANRALNSDPAPESEPANTAPSTEDPVARSRATPVRRIPSAPAQTPTDGPPSVAAVALPPGATRPRKPQLRIARGTSPPRQ